MLRTMLIAHCQAFEQFPLWHVFLQCFVVPENERKEETKRKTIMFLNLDFVVVFVKVVGN